MPDTSPPKYTPQFETADYAGTPESDHCKICNQHMGASYYRVNGAMACGPCAAKARGAVPEDNHAAYMRALVFGVGAAVGGLILYAAFAIMTGLVIGYLSFAVGYIVGKAMKAGSRGLGGRRYQVTAVLLTYAAVSMAAIPVAISQFSKQKDAQRPAQTEQVSPPDAHRVQQGESPPREPKSVGRALAILLVLGLASPFLELQNPIQGLIGLVILFVGIRIAWKITEGTSGVEILGPFRTPASTPASPSAG